MNKLLHEPVHKLVAQAKLVQSVGVGIGAYHLLLRSPVQSPPLHVFAFDSWMQKPHPIELLQAVLSTADQLLVKATQSAFDPSGKESNPRVASTSHAYNLCMQATFRCSSIMQCLPRLPADLVTRDSPLHPGAIKARLALAARLRATVRAIMCLRDCMISDDVYLPSLAILYLNLASCPHLLPPVLRENLFMVVLGLLLRCNLWESCKMVADFLLSKHEIESTPHSPTRQDDNQANQFNHEAESARHFKKLISHLCIDESLLSNESLRTKVRRIQRLASDRLFDGKGAVNSDICPILPHCVSCGNFLNPFTGSCAQCGLKHRLCWISLVLTPVVCDRQDASKVNGGITCGVCNAFVSEMCRKVLYNRVMNEHLLNNHNASVRKTSVNLCCPFCGHEGMWRGMSTLSTRVESRSPNHPNAQTSEDKEFLNSSGQRSGRRPFLSFEDGGVPLPF
eukprot:GDKJ01039567.1.p1 GENE.GDKJ01039567.1~~GDKJ01039567.1.p1  ORF type:complete len:465 (-),score=52.59 GDKJ01039567.1:46-1401(-)